MSNVGVSSMRVSSGAAVPDIFVSVHVSVHPMLERIWLVHNLIEGLHSQPALFTHNSTPPLFAGIQNILRFVQAALPLVLGHSWRDNAKWTILTHQAHFHWCRNTTLRDASPPSREGLPHPYL